jgi:hypothetical protein
VNDETQEQSKQWMHTHSPNKLKKFKQTSTCQKADDICFLGQERSADGGIHATRDHNSVRSALRNTKKNCVGPFRTKGVECRHPVVFLHDNAHPHTDIHTQALLEYFNWELFDHPSYSCSKQLPPVYLPEELVGITVLQQQ